MGEFLPLELIYTGTTSQCHPLCSFPFEWHITRTENNWSNEQTMPTYMYVTTNEKTNHSPQNIAEEGLVGIGRTGWHIDGSFLDCPGSHSIYCILSAPHEGSTGRPMHAFCFPQILHINPSSVICYGCYTSNFVQRVQELCH